VILASPVTPARRHFQQLRPGLESHLLLCRDQSGWRGAIPSGALRQISCPIFGSFGNFAHPVQGGGATLSSVALAWLVLAWRAR